MRKRFSKLSLFFKRIGFYIPFTWHFVLFIVAGSIGCIWLRTQAEITDSSYKDIFTLLFQFAAWFCFVLLSFGLISVLISYFFFAIKKRKNRIDFNIATQSKHDKEDLTQTINIHIRPILKPFLGFIKLRFNYDEKNYSSKFNIVKRSDKKLFSTNFDGSYKWYLPEIKEYRVEKVYVYFEDLFQFFSFPVSLTVNSSFHTEPSSRKAKIITAFPRKTEDTSIRIEELKKVEGEHINYKNFESNDDVRRIVWKIYAKNKELVVRIPEILDPYASHIYLYASYFSFFNVKGNEAIEKPFLNFYKTICWSVYKQLLQKGFEIRYVPDQNIPQNTINTADEQMKYTISASHWQTDSSLKQYVNTRSASVIIISSLSNVEDVKNILEQNANEISFVFVPLTKCLDRQHLGDWIQWLFLQKEKDDISVYKPTGVYH